jgi:hypothetical protein
MPRQDQRSGRGRRLGERRGGRGAGRAEETTRTEETTSAAARRRRLKLERRSGHDRRSVGALDAILKGDDES